FPGPDDCSTRSWSAAVLCRLPDGAVTRDSFHGRRMGLCIGVQCSPPDRVVPNKFASILRATSAGALAHQPDSGERVKESIYIISIKGLRYASDTYAKRTGSTSPARRRSNSR